MGTLCKLLFRFHLLAPLDKSSIDHIPGISCLLVCNNMEALWNIDVRTKNGGHSLKNSQERRGGCTAGGWLKLKCFGWDHGQVQQCCAACCLLELRQQSKRCGIEMWGRHKLGSMVVLTFVFMVFRKVVSALPIADNSSLIGTTSFSAGRPLTLRACIAFWNRISIVISNEK